MPSILGPECQTCIYLCVRGLGHRSTGHPWHGTCYSQYTKKSALLFITALQTGIAQGTTRCGGYGDIVPAGEQEMSQEDERPDEKKEMTRRNGYDAHGPRG